jgi:quercetin dioxygenase-like cupin family protein
MAKRLKYVFLFLVVIVSACNSKLNTQETTQGSASIFPKGELLKSENFKGTVWLQMFGAKDSTLYARFGNVTFEAKARTNWHSHPGGQVLFITEGKGYYQAKGQPARLVKKGDVVEIPRNVVHWHGAAPDSEFAHIAISLNSDEGGAVWIGPVTDDEYLEATK